MAGMVEMSVHRHPERSRAGVQQYTAGGIKAEEERKVKEKARGERKKNPQQKETKKASE